MYDNDKKCKYIHSNLHVLHTNYNNKFDIGSHEPNTTINLNTGSQEPNTTTTFTTGSNEPITTTRLNTGSHKPNIITTFNTGSHKPKTSIFNIAYSRGDYQLYCI